jgi:uncharacterized protein involved in cysteine biosynthesis
VAEPSLDRPPPRPGTEWLAGVTAVLRGAGILLGTGGTKRWLVPPFLLTVIGAVVVFRAWIGPAIDWFFALAEADGDTLAWWERWLGWLADTWFFGVLHGVSWWLALIVTVWLTFTFLHEALAGPFLDEIQGRLEARWFGRDPLEGKERPVDLPVAVCAQRSLVWGGVGVALGAAFAWWSPGWWWLATPLVALAPLWVAGRLDPEYGRWLAWAGGREAHLLWISVKVALFTGLVMVLFFWLPWVPLIGPPLYVALSGFSLALGLLDLPFSRRGWIGRQRVGFVTAHLPAFLAYGVTASFLVGVPIVGPVLAVPVLSIGGQWLVIRLDKSGVRRRALGRTAAA